MIELREAGVTVPAGEHDAVILQPTTLTLTEHRAGEHHGEGLQGEWHARCDGDRGQQRAGGDECGEGRDQSDIGRGVAASGGCDSHCCSLSGNVWRRSGAAFCPVG